MRSSTALHSDLSADAKRQCFWLAFSKAAFCAGEDSFDASRAIRRTACRRRSRDSASLLIATPFSSAASFIQLERQLRQKPARFIKSIFCTSVRRAQVLDQAAIDRSFEFQAGLLVGCHIRPSSEVADRAGGRPPEMSSRRSPRWRRPIATSGPSSTRAPSSRSRRAATRWWRSWLSRAVFVPNDIAARQRREPAPHHHRPEHGGQIDLPAAGGADRADGAGRAASSRRTRRASALVDRIFTRVGAHGRPGRAASPPSWWR